MMTINEVTIPYAKALCSQRHPALLLAAATFCHDLREHQATASILELCVKLDADNRAAHLLLAKSYVASDRRLQAISTLKRVLALDPDSVEARSLLLWCFTGLTDEEEKAITAS